MGFECTYPKTSRVSFPSNNDPEYMRRVEDRLGNVESLLESVISKSTLIEPQENLISSQDVAGFDEAFRSTTSPQPQDASGGLAVVKDFSNPETTTIDLADDTVDGMGAIAFADELSSGHFGNADA